MAKSDLTSHADQTLSNLTAALKKVLKSLDSDLKQASGEGGEHPVSDHLADIVDRAKGLLDGSLELKEAGGWPNYPHEVAAAVYALLRTGKVNSLVHSKATVRFRRAFADYVQASHAVTVANGTVALDLALYGVRIGSNYGGSARDEVILTPRSFFATVSCVPRAGANPVFADVDRETQNITAKSVREKISKYTKAIICVHLDGWPCDIDAIRSMLRNPEDDNNKLLLRKGYRAEDLRKIRIVEDCAQAHGARLNGRFVGGIGDVAAWSFCQDKIMTTGGEGGLVTCNDEDLFRRMWSFKDHGKSIDYEPGTGMKYGDFEYNHTIFGTNWRMTEMQAFIGLLQMFELEGWLAERQKNADATIQCLKPLIDNGVLRVPVRTCGQCEGKAACTKGEDGCRPANYKFTLFANNGFDRGKLLQFLNDKGFKVRLGTSPEMYLEPAFRDTKWDPRRTENGGDGKFPYRLPVAQQLGDTSLTFAIHPGIDLPEPLTDDDLDLTALKS